jgi:membrane protein DedA with SNARE-associated domain
MFFQDDRGWMIYGLAMAAVIGMAIGALTGSVVSFVLRLSIRGVQWDALLGSIGYVAATRIPWPGSATNHNVAMTIVTLALAATLPILRELYRFRKKDAIKSEA